MTRGILIGIVLTLAAIAAGAYAFIAMGLVPANADSAPPGIERWAA